MTARRLIALLLPAVLWAQSQTIPESAAPAEVSQALRARVTEFFNYHVGSVNRKAIDLVAEDSQDTYFEGAKEQIRAFQIAKIEYFPEFQRAAVTIEVTRNITLQGENVTGTSPLVTNWKIEAGQWVWFYDKNSQMLPMSASDFKTVKVLEVFSNTGKLPEGFNRPEALAAQMEAILDQSKLDKSEVAFTIGVAGQERVVLQNRYTGYIDLALPGAMQTPGLKVSLEKTALKPGENGVILFQYDPPEEAKPEPEELTVRLRVDPFSQYFPVKVILRPAAK